MNGEEFEKFDVTGEGFEAFDVTAEPEPEAEVSIEALGGLSESEDELRSVSQARDELEKRLMLDPGEAAFAAAEEGAARGLEADPSATLAAALWPFSDGDQSRSRAGSTRIHQISYRYRLAAAPC